MLYTGLDSHRQNNFVPTLDLYPQPTRQWILRSEVDYNFGMVGMKERRLTLSYLTLSHASGLATKEPVSLRWFSSILNVPQETIA